MALLCGWRMCLMRQVAFPLSILFDLDRRTYLLGSRLGADLSIIIWYWSSR
jgi:hypothetical protein